MAGNRARATLEDPRKFAQALDAMENVDVVFKDAKDWTLLTFACSTGNVEAARLLLDRFADPNHLARDGASPLVLACGRGDIDLVDLLLDARANVNRDAYGVTPLIAACAGGHVAVTWKLIESNADVNQVGATGDTPLMAAAGAGHREITALLIERSAVINYMNSKGFTALMRAAMHGNMDVVTLLCTCGADPTLRGLKGGGFNAEEVAARAGFTNVQAWLRAWRSKHVWRFRRAQLARELKANAALLIFIALMFILILVVANVLPHRMPYLSFLILV